MVCTSKTYNLMQATLTILLEPSIFSTFDSNYLIFLPLSSFTIAKHLEGLDSIKSNKHIAWLYRLVSSSPIILPTFS